MLSLLKRDRCRILHGQPNGAGFEWGSVPLLPELIPGLTELPRAEVRAVAAEDSLHVRFDCAVDDPARLAPPTPAAPLSEVERAVIDVLPSNEPTLRFRFQADYRGMTQASKVLMSVGESSLEAVPDVWTKSESVTGDWSKLHGLRRDGWDAEFIVPWRTLGLDRRPPIIGFGYERILRRKGFPTLDAASWNGPSKQVLLEPGEALIGGSTGHPEELLLEPPVFGRNAGRLSLGSNWPEQPVSLKVRTEGRGGRVIEESAVPIEEGQDVLEFAYWVDRAECNHVDVFNPPRLVLEVLGAGDEKLYRAELPMDRHLGLCVDEPFGVPSAAPRVPRASRDAWLARILPETPRLGRANTNDGAPSDFCLMFDDGSVAANLMADDAWLRLAAIVERLGSAGERLVAAMALVGQKTVTNLILCPMFLNAEGRHTYHSAMHEWMGPLSIVRYGGGPAVARAAALARMLQHVKDPTTGEPFVTRVVSMTNEGGPRQVTRTYAACTNLAPFVQEPGPVGAVAVDYRGSQTILDPTGMVFFPKSGALATVEEMLADELVLQEGAGRYASIYSRMDIDDVRHHLPDRMLSKGVFPELSPNEDNPDSPFYLGYRQEPRTLGVGADGQAIGAGFSRADGGRGVRDASMTIRWDEDQLSLSIRVEGAQTLGFSDQDREMERVHLAIDTAHNHQGFYHFLAVLGGARGARFDGLRASWREAASGIQTLFKNLSTENHTALEEVPVDWEATFNESPDRYQVTCVVPWSSVGLDGSELPPVIGLNVWIDSRRPHYAQVFLAPPRHRLPADPFSFADLYLHDSPVAVHAVDFGVPTWGENLGSAELANRTGHDAEVVFQARCVGGMERKTVDCEPVTATLPARGQARALFPFFIDPAEKMTSGSPQRLLLSASIADRTHFLGEWLPTYCGTMSVYQKYGGGEEDHQNPGPGDEDFLNRKIRYICAKLPRLERRTTRDGAASDFVVRSEDGSVEFNLMKEGVLDEMGDTIAGLFDSDLDRILGMFYLAQDPQMARHMSGGHRFMSGAGPLSVLRGNLAGGGGNCGYHSRAFAGMASHLKINGKRLRAHTVGIYGHVITAVEWRGSKALMDADVGHFFLTADGTDLATIEEFRNNPGVLTTAGPGELARYFTFDYAHTLSRPFMADEHFVGVFPPGAPKA